MIIAEKDIIESQRRQDEEDEWCHLDFCWNNDEQYIQFKNDLSQEELFQCQHTYESAFGASCVAAIPHMSVINADDLISDCSYPIQNPRLSRSDTLKMQALAIAGSFLPASYSANYRNPLTGRLDTIVDNSLSQEQQAIKIAKAEAKRLRKQIKRQGTSK